MLTPLAYYRSVVASSPRVRGHPGRRVWSGPKKDPCSILVLAYRPVFVPTRGRLLDRYGRARRKSKPNDKEPREGLVGAYEHNLSTSESVPGRWLLVWRLLGALFRDRGLPHHQFLPEGTQASSSGKNRLT